jgi:serine/threonine-protein kinase
LLDVVHRDVSPDNVFVTYDGVVKLVDFGVASARNRITHTTTGVLKGKHAYMAPELLGDGGFDRRADLFSVGVVLWEALTLRRLFRRDSEAKTLFAVVGDPIEAPSQVVPELDAALDAIVLRAHAREPADRYATARELARDLRGWLLDQRADVTAADVEAWVATLSPDGLAQRRALLAGVDRIVAEDDVIPVEVAEEPARAARSAHGERATRVPALAALGAAGALALTAAAVLAWSWGAQGTPPSEPSLPRAEAAAPTPPSATPAPAPIAPAAVAAPAESAPPDAPSAPSAGTSQAAARPSRAAEPDPAPARPRRSRSSAAPTGDPGELRVGLRARGGGSLPDDAWAQVRIDGRAVDGSPPMSLRLPPGRHLVEVRPYGRSAGVSRTVEIEPGGREVAIFTIDGR